MNHRKVLARDTLRQPTATPTARREDLLNTLVLVCERKPSRRMLAGAAIFGMASSPNAGGIGRFVGRCHWLFESPGILAAVCFRQIHRVTHVKGGVAVRIVIIFDQISCWAGFIDSAG